MSSSSTMGLLAGVLALALAGCSGGGADVAQSATMLGGTVAAGLFKNADVKVYDATVGEIGTPITTATTAANGTYALTLPTGFYHPVLIVASAKTDGSSQVVDEIFGVQSTPAGFTMRSVIPSGTSSGAALTGYVTPYTNLMYQIVSNKIGKTDVDAAINQARSLVNQLTSNADPLTVNPATDASMVSLLAAVSNIANGTSTTTDPDGCHSQATAIAKIACTITTLSASIAPMSATAVTSSPIPLTLKQNVVTALANAMTTLNAATVASNNPNVTTAALTGPKATGSAYWNQLALQTGLTAPPSATASGITQAKAFFANLRSGILPYAGTNASSGFVNTQGKPLHTEMNSLSTGAMQGMNQVWTLNDWAYQIFVEKTVPTNCVTTGTNNSLSCTFRNGKTATLTATSTTQGNYVLYNGLTGSVSVVTSGSTVTITMNGHVDPMVAGTGNRTRVGLGNGTSTNATTGVACTGDDAPLISTWPATKAHGSNVTVTYTVQGTLKNQVPDAASGLATCSGYAPNLKLNFSASGTPSTITGNPVDYSQDSGHFTGIFTTKNYSFTGQLDVNSLTSRSNANGTMINGGNASFTGTVTGIGLNYRDIHDNQVTQDTDATNDFTLLVGNLLANIDGTHFDPSQPSSTDNYQTGTATFTGTTFLSAADPGLKLILSLNGTGWETGTGTVIFNDYNRGISLTGIGNYGVSGTAGMTIFDGNGISLSALSSSNPLVWKGSLQLGNVRNGIVTYSDGTFELL